MRFENATDCELSMLNCLAPEQIKRLFYFQSSKFDSGSGSRYSRTESCVTPAPTKPTNVGLIQMIIDII